MRQDVSQGAHELRSWFARNGRGLCDREMAQRLGCSVGHMHNVATGRFAPSLRLAAAIERETGVPARSWLTPAEDRAA